MSELVGDLTGATRDELLAVIAEQQATIATLQARIAELERRLGSSGGKGVPGIKPKQRSKASGQPRKRRDRGYARVRMTPTRTVQHAAETCPDCGTRLAGGWVTRHREVIELPDAPVTVTDHQIVARTCPRCQRLVLPPDPLAGVVVGKQRFG
ncbi:MAG: IS66 family transposase zinc-finger binding domain-containing protein, partial [Pseudonocardiaceae bacterium]